MGRGFARAASIIGSASIIGVAGVAFSGLAAGRTVTVATAFSGNVCGIPSARELTAAHISAPCHKVKTAKVPVKKSPLGGSIGSITWSARWGSAVHAPTHYLGVGISKELGSGTAHNVVMKHFRGSVLQHGALINVGKGLASIYTDTASCSNPPTDDCTRGTVLAVVGNYVVNVSLDDYPPTNPGAEPSPGDDEGEDNAQEDAIKPALRQIAKSVVAKL
jgi:hypothetical protein